MTSAYNSSDVSQYLDYIGLPDDLRSLTQSGQHLDYNFLHQLHIHHISTIPYENLSLHYSPTRTNNLNPRALFQKFVQKRRGGYCMETAIFYNHILRALGFTTYTAGVKIRLRNGTVPFGDYIGWLHVVNIVTLSDGTKWMCDVGFGGDGATKPVPLVDGAVVHNLGSQYIRLIQDNIPEQIDRSRKYWIYQYRNSSEQEWNSYYAFPEWEFSEVDLGVMNYYTSQYPQSFQVNTILVVKFLRKDSDITGKLMLVNDTVKKYPGEDGRTEVVAVCKTEAERIVVLRKWFGMELDKEDIEGIRGHVTELKSVNGV